MLLSSAPIVFGEPFAPGWVTPALPLVLAYLIPGDKTLFATPAEGFQMMTAMTIDFAIILFFMGITGLGQKVIDWIPNALKGGIIMGAAIAALYRVFLSDPSLFAAQPWTTGAAISVCLFLTFSLPVQRLKLQHRWLAILAGLGLLPGFIIAAIVGPIAHEVSYDVQGGILVPSFLSLFHKVSPFSIGWPSLHMYWDTLPLAAMGYVILFGDLITGVEVLKLGTPARPDEKIDIDLNRAHFSLGIRNVLMSIFSPFFPTQGTLWTGVHVIVVQRWMEGRKGMDSLYSGIASYYVFGIPLLYMIRPLVTALQPLFSVALSLTLVLTGFACAYVSMGLQRTTIERGVVILIGVCLAIFNPWAGMGIAIVATFTLVGFRNPEPVVEPFSEDEEG